jgi:hypothetical protein
MSFLLLPSVFSTYEALGGKMVSTSDYSDNGLLAQLRILPHLQLVRLKFSDIVYKPLEVITH